MNKKIVIVLAGALGLGPTMMYPEEVKPAQAAPTAPVGQAVQAAPKVDPDNPPRMEVKEADPNAWKPVEPAKDAKPVAAVLMSKGAANDNLVIKMVSVCDQNNVWCVANDGTKDAIYQLTSKGLEHTFDGVYVASGKGIVAAINDKQEVFELEGGKGTAWKKVEGLKLTKISRPNTHVGWGLLETGKGKISCFMFDEDEEKWMPVKNAAGQEAQGIVDLAANAEDIVLALTDKGELLKRDLQREQMFEKAKKVMEEKKKGGKKGAHKGHGKHAKHAKAGEKAKHADKKKHPVGKGENKAQDAAAGGKQHKGKKGAHKGQGGKKAAPHDADKPAEQPAVKPA